MNNTLAFNDLVELVENVISSNRLYTEEELCSQLFAFTANCPDPAAADSLITESEERLTAEEIVRRALSYPQRDGASYTEDELPKNHYLRFISAKDQINPLIEIKAKLAKNPRPPRRTPRRRTHLTKRKDIEE